MQIKIKCDNDTIAPLEASHFAQSAFDNEIDLNSFLASLDNFCNQSVSPIPDIRKWREEATEKYFTLLSNAGLLTWTATPFEGGSDFDESETALGDINTNKM